MFLVHLVPLHRMSPAKNDLSASSSFSPHMNFKRPWGLRYFPNNEGKGAKFVVCMPWRICYATGSKRNFIQGFQFRRCIYLDAMLWLQCSDPRISLNFSDQTKETDNKMQLEFGGDGQLSQAEEIVYFCQRSKAVNDPMSTHAAAAYLTSPAWRLVELVTALQSNCPKAVGRHKTNPKLSNKLLSSIMSLWNQKEDSVANLRQANVLQKKICKAKQLSSYKHPQPSNPGKFSTFFQESTPATTNKKFLWWQMWYFQGSVRLTTSQSAKKRLYLG